MALVAKRPSCRAGRRIAEPTMMHPGCKLLINARAHTRRGAPRSAISADGHVKATLCEAAELLLLLSPEDITHSRLTYGLEMSLPHRLIFTTVLLYTALWMNDDLTAVCERADEKQSASL